MSELVIQVLGQIESISFQQLQIGIRHGLVALELTGPDGNAYASLTHDQASSLVTGLLEQLRELDGE
jgi:hypothetical protein